MFSFSNSSQQNLQDSHGINTQIEEKVSNNDNLSKNLNKNNKFNKPTQQKQNDQNRNSNTEYVKKNNIDTNTKKYDEINKINEINEINKQEQQLQNKNGVGIVEKTEEKDNELNGSSNINTDTKKYDEINENEINEVNQNTININRKRYEESEDDKISDDEENHNKINEIISHEEQNQNNESEVLRKENSIKLNAKNEENKDEINEININKMQDDQSGNNIILYDEENYNKINSNTRNDDDDVKENEKNNRGLHIVDLQQNAFMLKLKHMAKLLGKTEKEVYKLRRYASAAFKMLKKKATEIASGISVGNGDITSKENLQSKEIDILKGFERYGEGCDGGALEGRYRNENIVAIFGQMKDTYKALLETFENMNTIFPNYYSSSIVSKKLGELKKIENALDVLSDELEESNLGENLKAICNSSISALRKHYDVAKYNFDKINKFYNRGKAAKVVVKKIYFNLKKVFEKMPNLKNLFIPSEVDFGKKGIIIKRRKENPDLIGCYFYDRDIVKGCSSFVEKLLFLYFNKDADGLIPLHRGNRYSFDESYPYVAYPVSSAILLPDFEQKNLRRVQMKCSHGWVDEVTWFDDFFHYWPEENE